MLVYLVASFALPILEIKFFLLYLRFFLLVKPWKSNTTKKMRGFLLDDDKPLRNNQWWSPRKPTYRKWWPRTSKKHVQVLITPNVITCNAIIASCGKALQWQQSLHVLCVWAAISWKGWGNQGCHWERPSPSFLEQANMSWKMDF